MVRARDAAVDPLLNHDTTMSTPDVARRPVVPGPRIILACEDPIEATALQAGLAASLGMPVMIRPSQGIADDDLAGSVVVISTERFNDVLPRATAAAHWVYLLFDGELPDGVAEAGNVTVLRRPVLTSDLSSALLATVSRAPVQAGQER